MRRFGNKFGNKRTVIDNITFASKAEAARYQELKLLQQVGAIKDLELQPRYPLVIDGQKICDYVGDFKYWDVDKSRRVVEDVKGFITPEFRLKKKLMLACHGIEIQEIGGHRRKATKKLAIEKLTQNRKG